jgi:hypothetical protein
MQVKHINNTKPVYISQSTICISLLHRFHDLYDGDVPLLNFDTITFVWKVRDEDLIKQLIPLCPLNVSFKIFTELATNTVDYWPHSDNFH